MMEPDLRAVPGFLFFDHVAISVRPGELEAHVGAYKTLGFTEVHREDVLGTDQVREVLLQVGDGPNLVQLIEPLSPESPVAKQIEKNGGRGGLAHVALRVADIQAAFDYMDAQRVQDHRQGAAQGVARHDGVLRPSQDDRGGLLRLHPRGRAGGFAMPDGGAPGRPLRLAEEFPPVAIRGVGRRHPQGPQGRRLRQETGVAHRRRALRCAPTTGRKTSPGSTRRRQPCRARRRGCAAAAVPGRPGRAEHPAGRRPRRSAARCRGDRRAGDRLRDRGGRGAPRGGHRRGHAGRGGRGGRSTFVFAVGSSYFVEIAKLRAARLCWAQAVAAFGDAGGEAARMRTIVRTRAVEQEPLRPVHEPAARDDRGDVGGVRRRGPADRRAGGVRRPPRARTCTRILRGGVASRRGGRSGRRVLLRRGADRRARPRGLEAAPGGRSRGRIRRGASRPARSQTASRHRARAKEKAVSVAPPDARRREQLPRPGRDGAGACRRSPPTTTGPRRPGAWPSPSSGSAAAPERHAAATGRRPRVLLLTARRRPDAHRTRELLPATSSGAPASTWSSRTRPATPARPRRAVQLGSRVPRRSRRRCAAGVGARDRGGQSEGTDRGARGRRRAGLRPRAERRRADADRSGRIGWGWPVRTVGDAR